MSRAFWATKLPIRVKAVEWLKMGDHPAVFFSRNVFGEPLDPRVYYIQTLEGVMTVKPGDFVMEGIKGELYAIDKEIFHATYTTERIPT